MKRSKEEANNNTLQELEIRAQKIGWSLRYPEGSSLNEEEIVGEREKAERQFQLYDKVRVLWAGRLPRWVQEELVFPITESWVSSVEARHDFHMKWQIEWEREKENLHPDLHHKLPKLPLLIQSADVSLLIAEMKRLQKDVWNRLWLLCRNLSPRYYEQKKETKARIELLNLEHNKVQIRKERLWIEREVNRLAHLAVGFHHTQQKRWEDAGTSLPASLLWIGVPTENSYTKKAFPSTIWGTRYPITQEVYEAVMRRQPSYFEGKLRPVENVSWCDAIIFCNTLSLLEGLDLAYQTPESFQNTKDWAGGVVWKQNSNGYRLPTVAEWEYCARSGQSFRYAGSNDIKKVAAYRRENTQGTLQVGQKKPNSWGFFDMSGNVWEWCWDEVFEKNAQGHKSSCGGCWQSFEIGCTISFPVTARPESRSMNRGFRIFRNG